MNNATTERLIAKILSIGAGVTTILIVSGSVTDPVNAPKLVAIGVMGTAALGTLLMWNFRKFVQLNKIEVVLGAMFTLAMLVSITTSSSPLSQNLYGSYGRNNGFATYAFLLAIFLSAVSFRNQSSFESIVKALLFAGVINIVYCLWVLLFGDFIGWSNPYGNILGTLGNPNFIGAFLGIFFTSYLAYSQRKAASKFFRFSALAVLPITAFEIYKSHAIQGRVVAALGVGILGFLIIRSKFNNLITSIYLLVGSTIGAFALLGALQKGPLAQVIYKTSVSLRGQYWLAGWNTGSSHPFTGVGMDAFGDWYRRTRDIHALELPGVSTVVNAAHNVPIDMFAFGGWPLLLGYLMFMLISGISAFHVVRRTREFDPVFAVLLTAWAGYQLQSIISINQIGLAVWGWLLSGALVAYEKMTRVHLDTSKVGDSGLVKNPKSSELHPSLVLVGVLSAIAGLVISLPPMVSDSKWRSAQVARSAQAIEATMTPGIFNPQNSQKYLRNIQDLEQSSLFELSHKYALQAVTWNPEAFELWKVLYLLKNSTAEEKAIALKNMKRLDPLNPDVTSIQ